MTLNEYLIKRIEEIYDFRGTFIKETEYDLGVVDTFEMAKEHVRKWVKEHYERYHDKYATINISMEMINDETIELNGSLGTTVIRYEIIENPFGKITE